MRFSAVVGGLSNLICGFILVLVGLSSQAVKYEYNLCGFSPVLMGFAVGFKQFYPDKEQSLFGTVKFTLNMLPLIMLGVSLFFGLFSMFKPFLQGVVALFVSWVYLRFYQKKPGGVVGDRSPGFAFHTMFPAVLHPFLTKLESIVGGLLRIRNSEQQQQPGQPQTEMMLPVSVQDTRQELYPEQQHAPQETGRQKYGTGHTLGE